MDELVIILVTTFFIYLGDQGKLVWMIQVE
jgi:hypothetical protein